MSFRYIRISIAALLVLLATPVLASTVQSTYEPLSGDYRMPEWSSVSHDTCKKNPGCTASWALLAQKEIGKVPGVIAAQAILHFAKADWQMAHGQVPDWKVFYVCEGDVVTTSFSDEDGNLIVIPQIRATFKGCTPGYGWTFYDPETGTPYEVFRIIECGNYTTRVPLPASTGYISGPLLSSFVPHRSYGGAHGFGGGFASIGGGGSGGSKGGNTYTTTFISNVTNITNEYCDICCDEGGGHEPPPPPSAVPLPASGLLLFFTLLLLPLAARKLKTKRI